MKLLLHTCCGPCATRCVDELRKEQIEPTLFWHNPNIHPFTEYKSRLNALRELAAHKKLELIELDEYGLRPFLHGIAEFENRCQWCYRTRLEKTAQYAAEHNYTHISSTLLISPYQNHALIMEEALLMARAYGVEFLYRDFRPFFRDGQNDARATGLYMQKYCGCIFSEEERYLNKKKK